MSTIAYKGGLMVADSMAYCGRGMPSLGSKDKTRRMPDGTLVGVSTAVVGGGNRVLDWFEAGCPEDFTVPDEFSALVVDPKGKVFLYRDSPNPTGPLKAPFYAIGSGGEYALGAMQAGADALQAVRIATRFDPFSGGRLTTIRR